ncbi:hypothetical protein POTOM_061050 [Populus tomentosa]|uniref:ARM repeat superfamily protein n=1 Tax=Populus tomentosa TaxID=118781 RepID=A0A8X8BZZ6_POPTO|nr:hypothetical protein POTOM_061050 [Populus tomentosa]
MGQVKDRVYIANQFAWLARDNDRNKKTIVEEGGIFLLLKLLKEGASTEAPIVAATVLFNIANDKHRVRLIVDALGTSMIVGVLGDSPLKVQISVANLVAKMIDLDDNTQEEIVEREMREMQFNCLMIIIEITVVAGSKADLRHAAFKPNLPGAKTVLAMLLRVIQEESDPKLQILIIRNVDITIEAAMTLGKFACPENFNCSEHSKGLVLLCYLALNTGNRKALEQARTLNALEGTT